jgi:thioredoxin-like negative regulator of GroEL
MSEPLRTETTRAPEPRSRAEREAKIEQLLLDGLDQYFAGQYEQAINVWTRALFLDRNHARARAYIDRARSAQAERQREAEALLNDAAAAIQHGDSTAARRLLDAAVARGGVSDDVPSLRERIDRIERSSPASLLAASQSDPPRLTLDEPPPSRRSLASWIALGAFVLIIVAAGLVAATAVRSEWGGVVDRSLNRRIGRTMPAAASSVRDVTLLPLPRRSESALARARTLVSSGKLRDALPLLDTIRMTDPEHADADRLRAEIQHQLIALGPLPAAPSSEGTRP